MEIPDNLKEKVEELFANHNDYLKKILSKENQMKIFSKNIAFTSIDELKKGLLALDSVAITMIGSASQIGFRPEEIVFDYGKEKLDKLLEDAKIRVNLRQVYIELFHLYNLNELKKSH